MGAVVSKDNDALVDLLVRNDYIKHKNIEQVFRLVDRGRFIPEEYREDAYREAPFKIPDTDTEWKPGKLHVSAPSMYAVVVEKLELQEGHTFLNIGSGTGWLNTVAGFLIGSDGINHGIEIHKNLVDYSYERMRDTLSLPEVRAFDWCPPTFVHGNGLAQKPNIVGYPLYDRIYCGASLPNEAAVRQILCLLEIGGKLIAPVGDRLMMYICTAEARFLSQSLMACSFANLLSSHSGDRSDVLPLIRRPFSLKIIGRSAIHQTLRKAITLHSPVVMRSTVDEENDEGESGSNRISLYFTGQNEEEGLQVDLPRDARTDFVPRDGVLHFRIAAGNDPDDDERDPVIEEEVAAVAARRRVRHRINWLDAFLEIGHELDRHEAREAAQDPRDDRRDRDDRSPTPFPDMLIEEADEDEEAQLEQLVGHIEDVIEAMHNDSGDESENNPDADTSTWSEPGSNRSEAETTKVASTSQSSDDVGSSAVVENTESDSSGSNLLRPFHRFRRRNRVSSASETRNIVGISDPTSEDSVRGSHDDTEGLPHKRPRLRTEQSEESEATKAQRVQRESLAKFAELFDKAVAELPLPPRIRNFLKMTPEN